MEPSNKPQTPSPTRRASPHIKVWVLPSEKAAIQAKAAAHTLSDSAYLRALGLDLPLRSTLDQEAVLELAKINGDLGRLGGVLRAWLAQRGADTSGDRVRILIAELETTQALLFEKVQRLTR